LSMRISSFIVLAIAFLMLVNCACDEFKGVTHDPSGRNSKTAMDAGLGSILTKQANPEQFRNAMTYRWSMAMIISIVGVIWFASNQRTERNDPMAPDADEKIDEELRQDEVDERGE